MQLSSLSKTVCMAVFFLFITVNLNAATTDKDKQTDFVAKVNDAAITRKDFDRSLAVASQQFDTVGNTQGAGEVNVKQEVLDRMIELELMYQDSIKRDITIADSLVEENVRGFLKQFEKEEDFLNFLQEQNMTNDDLRKHFRRKLAMRQLQGKIRQELKGGVTVTDAEAAEFYQNNLDRFKQPEQVKASHILIKVKHDADAETAKKARQEINKLLADIKEGADFAETARSYSQGPSSTKGGDLGFFSRGKMVKSFEDAAFSMKPNEISDVVETQFGYHLIMVTDQRAEQTIPLDEAKEDITQFFSQIKLDEALKAYIDGLRDKAKIVILEKF